MKAPIKFVIIALAIFFVTALVFSAYRVFNIYKEDKSTLSKYEKQLHKMIAYREGMEARSSNKSQLQQQFERIRVGLIDMIGMQKMLLIEAPLCDVYREVVKSQSFVLATCELRSGDWLLMKVIGQKENKKKLYENLEALFHPVQVRSVMTGPGKSPGEIMVVLIIRDKYNSTPMVPIVRPSELLSENLSQKKGRMFFKENFIDIKTRTERETEKLLLANDEVIQTSRIKSKTSQLLQIMNHVEHPEKNVFSFSEKERSLENFHPFFKDH